MTTKYYVYRGVQYTKDADKNIPVARKNTLMKMYRGVAYKQLQRAKHIVCDHVYRGQHYMA